MTDRLLGPTDLHLFNEGTHTRLHSCLGAHSAEHEGRTGVIFGVWAPNAQEVEVFGDFNDWANPGWRLDARGGSGLWEGFVPGVDQGSRYKFRIRSHHDGYTVEKTDPLGRFAEVPPQTASVVQGSNHRWGDAAWMAQRAAANPLRMPMSIYELHLGSWRRVPEDMNRPLDYREMGDWLVRHLRDTAFTHVELLPVMEHPFYGSWGYQCTGYFSPTSRFGTPDDLKYMIDQLHQAGYGVILDWVPSHFPTDEHGLIYFDGTHLFEHADPRQGYHPDWGSAIFNYGRNEVRSFLTSSACFWMDEFHADGLRVDAVASMLYLDYSRREGEWVPNQYGGRENLEAMDFLRHLNRTVLGEFPGAVTIAEESTAWPMVSRPVELGGLGFSMKWDMGWMHDTLEFFAKDPIHRRYHHGQLTFRQIYAFNENFVMPLSHDEVVHGKGSLYGKMPGDHWHKMANLRLLYAYMYAMPGKKLLFQGAEIGTAKEWNHEASLDWHLLHDPLHGGLMRCLGDLNRMHTGDPAMHALDFEPAGFDWIDCSDADQSILSLMRKGEKPENLMVVVFNFTPVPRSNYRVGVPQNGFYREVLNTDAGIYGGSDQGNFGGMDATPVAMHGYFQSLSLTLPPLGAVFLRYEG
ncbi:MAG: 1,4-alpha-glucan branching protein GlgB [Myxococcota bacterium]